MILYNTLIGVCAGLGMIFVANLLGLKRHAELPIGELAVRLQGWGVALLAVGAPLTFFAGLMTVTWPLSTKPAINIAFSEPNVLLGILLTLAGIFLMKGKTRSSLIAPSLWIVFTLGWILVAIASAIFSYNLVGDAPAIEPISGQIHGWENTAFGVAYLVAAAGCLTAPWALRQPWAYHVTRWSFYVAGFAFLAFCVLNYRTHIGLTLNRSGGHWRW